MDRRDHGPDDWQEAVDRPHRILEAAARFLRRSRPWRRRLEEWGVVDVCPGQRLVGRRQKCAGQLVLVLFVERKWTKTEDRERDEEGRIPRELTLRFTFEGIRGRFRIPVDVRPRVRPRAQGTSRGLAVPRDGETSATLPFEKGAACTVVRRPGFQAAYLLSCLHVLGSPDWVPGSGLPARLAVFERPDGSGDEKRLAANPSIPARFDSRQATDAALAALTPDGERKLATKTFWGRARPRRAALTRAEIRALRRYEIHRPIGRAIRCEWVSDHDRLEVEIARPGGTHVYVVHDVIGVRCTSTEGGRPARTEGGDSGAPVMAGDVLVGMHFAGSGELAWFVPTSRLLFDVAAFPGGLRLAADLLPEPVTP
ncbi:MAG: hypothetical protein R3F20_03760 [Planctomycetota bacterium]